MSWQNQFSRFHSTLLEAASCPSIQDEDIELHTGAFAAAATTACAQQELQTIISSVKLGKSLGLRVNAGHGLNYNNVQAIAAIAGLYELNIGHAIISQAVMIGLPAAVKSMKGLILGAQLL